MSASIRKLKVNIIEVSGMKIMVAMLNLADRKSKDVTCRNDRNKVEGEQSQGRSFSVQTCRVTYGGVDGAYYTSTRTRRAGGDGVSNVFLGFDMSFSFFFV